MGLADRLHEQVRALRRYALMLTRNPDDAEDLAQETLTKAIAAAHTWRPDSDLRPWLFRILHNTYVSDLRRRKVRGEVAGDMPEPAAPDNQLAQIELRQVLDALAEIPEAQRRPIVLVALEDMSYAEAAQTLDLPLGTFMSRLGRGREALRKLVNGAKRAKLSLIA